MCGLAVLALWRGEAAAEAKLQAPTLVLTAGLEDAHPRPGGPLFVRVKVENASGRAIVVPDFDDELLNITYLFDLSIQRTAKDAQPLPLLRPMAVEKAAHAPPARIPLGPGAARTYRLDLRRWRVIAAQPPTYRDLSSGAYVFQIVWAPTRPEPWWSERGLTWIPRGPASVPVRLQIEGP